MPPPLPYDYFRCVGEYCKQKECCQRHTDKAVGACVGQVSTYNTAIEDEAESCNYFISNKEERK